MPDLCGIGATGTERPEVADVRTSVIYEHLRNHAVAPAAGP
jgi:hypothetical protein